MIDDLLSADLQLSGDHWQDDLRGLAHGVRRSALAHPEVNRCPAQNWVKSDMRGFRHAERGTIY